MRNATELMVQYAHYHRDRRNIATHFVGIPLIVLAVGVLRVRGLGGFALGWGQALLAEIARQAGPTVLRPRGGVHAG